MSGKQKQKHPKSQAKRQPRRQAKRRDRQAEQNSRSSFQRAARTEHDNDQTHREMAATYGLRFMASLRVGRPTIPPSGEAEATAQRVVSGQAAPAIGDLSPEPTNTRSLERPVQKQGKESSLEPWPEPVEGEMESVQQNGPEEAQALHDVADQGSTASRATQMGPEGGEVQDAALAQRLRAPSGGRPLKTGVREHMERSFQADFSAVRVHDTPQDQQDARALGARAVALGGDVWLGRGESESDTRLMAHELTHVVQRGAAPQRSHSENPNRIQQKRTNADRSTISRLSIAPKIAGWAHNLPGYSLLTVTIGYDPIARKQVERSATNLVGALMGLIPGGNLLVENLKKSGALEKAFAWLSAQFTKIGLTWAAIKTAFSQAWEKSSILSPFKSWERIKAVFATPIQRLWQFAKSVGGKILDLIFEAVMARAGPLGARILAVIRKAGDVVTKIVKDPIGFLGNLIKAIGKGVHQFGSNIWAHLKNGLMGWMFGTLSKAGVELPERFDLKGFISLATQIMGITYIKMRQKLVKVIGEKRVAYLEKTMEAVRILMTEGIAGIWQQIADWVGNLKDLVMNAVKEWVVTKVVTQAVTKLASLFTPAGALIQAVQGIYETLSFFVAKIQQLADFVGSIVNSIAEIAYGKLSAAANYIENSMAKTLPLIISFLARLIGLGDISGKIKAIVIKLQAKVDGAIDKTITWIVGKAKKLWAKATGKEEPGKESKSDSKKKPPTGGSIEQILSMPEAKVIRSLKEKNWDLTEARSLLQRIAKKAKTSEEFLKYLPRVKARFGLKEITVLALGQPASGVEISLNPKAKLELDGEDFILNSPEVKGEFKQDVRFKTSTLVGGVVGVEMEAKKLGPNHPQGAPPTGGSLKPIMDRLITDPTKPKTEKYIRGHLLNDNVGGPGKNENLFPITASANQQHESQVESIVKDWVNNKKFWVYYKVTIEGSKESLPEPGKHAKNFVDSKLVCEASPLNADGEKAKGGFKKTIVSQSTRAGTEAEKTLTGPAPKGTGTAASDSKLKDHKPELSTSKRATGEMDKYIKQNLTDLRNKDKNKFEETVQSITGIGPKTAARLNKYLRDGKLKDGELPQLTGSLNAAKDAINEYFRP